MYIFFSHVKSMKLTKERKKIEKKACHKGYYDLINSIVLIFILFFFCPFSSRMIIPDARVAMTVYQDKGENK